MGKIKVLFFAADPVSSGGEGGRLRLDEDVRAIRQTVRAAEFRDALEFDVRWAARPDDLIQAFNETRPRIVHFSGHGTEAGLVLAGENGAARPVPAAALVRLFRVFSEGVRVVVLNACYSRAQAEAIAQSVGCAVGTRGLVPDRAALLFGASFYRAIAFGRSVQEACDQAGVAVAMAGYPDECCPELLAREGVDPREIVLVKPPAPGGVHFVNVGYSDRSFGMFHFRDHDVGTLSIGGGEAVFRGEKGTVRVTGVLDVSHGKQGGDVFANWVKVRYGDPASPSVGYFSRQTLLGNLIGGSDDLFAAFQAMLDAPPGSAS